MGAWLVEAVPGDPPRDLAVHASTCAECMSRATALDALRSIDVGVADVPPVLTHRPASPSTIIIARRWAAGLASAAVIVLAIAALTNPFNIGSVGGFRIGGEASPTPNEGVLADAFGPPGDGAATGASPSASATDDPTGSPGPLETPFQGFAADPRASAAPGFPSAPFIPGVPGFTPLPTGPTVPVGTPTPIPAPGGSTPVPSESAPPPTPEPTPPPTQQPTEAPTPTPPPAPTPTPPPAPTPTPPPAPTPTPTPPPALDPSCVNGIDDDGDGRIDLLELLPGISPDPGCVLGLSEWDA
jgi:hypothetical protein